MAKFTVWHCKTLWDDGVLIKVADVEVSDKLDNAFVYPYVREARSTSMGDIITTLGGEKSWKVSGVGFTPIPWE
jgi:hypothetical protein